MGGGIGWLGMLVICSALIVVLLAPMAAVAGTFEHDAVNVLNTPSTLKSAQKYFGQQLLSHFKELKFGFKIKGITLRPRLLSQISAALLIALLTSASSAIQSDFVRLNTEAARP